MTLSRCTGATIESLESRQLFSIVFNPSIVQTNLVSSGIDSPSFTDDNLINPWGAAVGPLGNVWVANNGSGVATVYNASGQAQPELPFAPRVVTIPAPGGFGSGAAQPTGMAFNSSPAAFKVSVGILRNRGIASQFLFATEEGTIAGWNARLDPNRAVTAVDNSAIGAVYKGLAVAGTFSKRRLYAADFHNGRIDVFNRQFQAISVSGGFVDSNLPAGFAPFNIQKIDENRLYVTYSKQDSDRVNDVSGLGNGIVDVFDLSGHLKRRLATGGLLNSPWGVTVAPSTFGTLAGDILVGNFGDGRINVFSRSGIFQGQLKDSNGDAIAIDGLWSLNRVSNRPLADDRVFFTAGSIFETAGLFGTLTAV